MSGDSPRARRPVRARRAGRRATLAALGVLCLLVACGGEQAPQPAATPQLIPPTPRAEPSHALRLDAAARAAQAPFGMLRVAPASDDAASPTATLGFRHARAPRGPDLRLSVAAASGEAAEPPRWSATPGRLVGALAVQGLLAEVTTSQRVALYRFSVFPGSPLRVRVAWRDPGGGAASLVPARGRQALTGSLLTGDGAQLHLALRFDRSFRVLAPPQAEDARPRAGEASAPAPLELEFQPSDGVVHARLALSTVDVAAARANLGELPGWDYDAALASVRTAWDDALGRLRLPPDTAAGGAGVGAGRSTLRAALYRVLAHYGDITDRDGRYRAADGSVRRMPAGHAHIGNLDLAREHGALLPLLDLLAPERAADVGQTLLAHQVATGRLPSRTAWGRALGGSEPRAPLLALAGMVSRGTSGLDPARVLAPMVKPDTLYGAEAGWNAYLTPGYPAPGAAQGGGVGEGLRAAWADHAVALVAAALGDREVASAYAARSVLYRRLWNDVAGDFRADLRGPGAAQAPAPGRADGGPAPGAERWIPGRFDIDGLLGLLGGRQALADALGAWLSAAADGAAGGPAPRVPAFVPWLYGFSNDPDSGVRAVRRWQAAAVNGAADAATSAALLFAALGLFPVLDTAGEYVLGWPAIPQATILRADGPLEIVRETVGGAAADPVRLDGTPLPGRTLSHRRLVEGRELRFAAGMADEAGQGGRDTAPGGA